MKKIETDERYEYTTLFTVLVDSNKLMYEAVGVDGEGRLILHRSNTINNSSGYGVDDEYFYIDADEYKDCVKQARKNRQIGFFAYKKLLKTVPGQADATEEKPPKKDVVVSFEKVVLHLSGMRISSDYEITMDDGKATVTYYEYRYASGGPERVPEKSVSCEEQTVIDLLNSCNVLAWDGFHGPHPKGVLDGTMFRFDANVNGGHKIHADGSENFPKHYRDLTDGLYNILFKS